ncbi:MAG: YdeI family protein [Candidatus Nanopelagicales bacterium]
MDEEPRLVLETAEEMGAWIAAHEGDGGFWLVVPKAGSGLPGIGYADALQVALAHGWIDAQKRPGEQDGTWLQRFTPRRARSRWSQVNRGHAERLIAEGRMTPAGLAEVERARADGRWDAAYAPPSTAAPTPELAAALDAVDGARAAFEGLDGRNRFAVLHRAASPTTAKGRQSAATRLAEMLGRGETPYPH